MNECIIAMKSQSGAYRAIKLLRSAGISASAVNIDTSLTGHGCGFGVVISCGKADEALALFEKKHLRHGELIGSGR